MKEIIITKDNISEIDNYKNNHTMVVSIDDNGNNIEIYNKNGEIHKSQSYEFEIETINYEEAIDFIKMHAEQNHDIYLQIKE